MRVFGTRFLESMKQDVAPASSDWTWSPKTAALSRIYGSGNSTQSRMSTYAAEKDNREDEDRPNEGLAA